VGLVVKWEVVIMVNLRYNQRMKSQMIKIVVLKKYNLKFKMRIISMKRLMKKISQVHLKIECQDNNDCYIVLIYVFKNLGFYYFSTKI